MILKNGGFSNGLNVGNFAQKEKEKRFKICSKWIAVQLFSLHQCF
jgi:hypothetical protein